MKQEHWPNGMQPIAADALLGFACHSGVACFTECCRELDLALTPYDVLRLKRNLGITSGELLSRYVIVEWDDQQTFPTCYLTMVDDGRASCVFVASTGCQVYADRPGSCRAYPIGRGATRSQHGSPIESLVLLREPHCRGFGELRTQRVQDYLHDQGLPLYNRYNDALLALIQHPEVRATRFRPTRQQLDQYILALYDLDTYRKALNEGRINLSGPMTPSRVQALTGNDEELLLLGIRWLMSEFFGEGF